MLPNLEDLLLDTDLNAEIQPYLEAVGFHTQFALHVDANKRDDLDLLRWSRRNGFIYVCHDRFKDRDTKLRVYPDLFDNGGKILRIAGDSSQDPLTAVGKVLVDREKWKAWFEENDGIVIVRANNKPVYQPAHTLFARIAHHLPNDDPGRRIRHRRPGRQQPRTRQPPSGQQRLIG